MNSTEKPDFGKKMRKKNVEPTRQKKHPRIINPEEGDEGTEGAMFLETYMTMQRYAGVPGPRSFNALCNASRAIGVIRVPRYMKEAFACELRMRTQLMFEAQTGMSVPELLEHRQRKAREQISVPSASKSSPVSE